jgi:hypothetical protein
VRVRVRVRVRVGVHLLPSQAIFERSVYVGRSGCMPFERKKRNYKTRF